MGSLLSDTLVMAALTHTYLPGNHCHMYTSYCHHNDLDWEAKKVEWAVVVIMKDNEKKE